MPFLQTFAAGSVKGFKTTTGGGPEFDTPEGTTIATVYDKTSYATTINLNNAADFHHWAAHILDDSHYPQYFFATNGSRWAGDYGTGEKYWYIDLGISRTVSEITWSVVDGDGARNFMGWDGSNNMTTWSNFYSVPSPGAVNGTNQSTGTVNAGPYRYLRFRINHTSNNYGRYHSLTIYLAPVTSLTAVDLTATNAVSYSIAGLPSPFTFDTNTATIGVGTGVLNEGNSNYSTTGYNKTVTVTATSASGLQSSLNVVLAFKWFDGLSADRATRSAQWIRDNVDSNFASGPKYINTSTGGQQQCYCLNDGQSKGWMLVARYNADASQTVTQQADSIRGLSDVSQNGGNYWSADFGSYPVSNVMIWAAADFTDTSISSNTKVNWYYGVPSNRASWWHWLWNTSQTGAGQARNTNTANMGTVNNTNGTSKYGLTCNGTFDGPFKGSRWTNTGFSRLAFSDIAGTVGWIPDSVFNARSNMHSLHGATDAKWSTHATQVACGQDDNISAQIGYDDGNRAFFDDGTGSVGNNTTRVDSGYNTAATIWIR